MLKSLKKPIIKMIFQYINPKSYFGILKHSFAFQRLLNINYSTYHYVNLLMRELKNKSTGLFNKHYACITTLMDISEVSKEEMAQSKIFILYTQLKKITHLSETEIDTIFRHFICTVQPKFVYISCNSHMEPFDKFHKELSSSKLIICASRFEPYSFYNTLSKYQNQVFYITINSKYYLTFTDMINVRYIKFNTNGHHFIKLSQIVPLFPINKKPVVYCLDLNYLAENSTTINERNIRKVIVQCKEPKEETQNDLLFNSSTMSLKDKCIHALLFSYKKDNTGVENFYKFNEIGIQYPTIYGNYYYTNPSFILKFKDNKENRCLSDLQSIAISAYYEFPPNLSLPNLEEIIHGYCCLNSLNFPNIKHLGLIQKDNLEQINQVLEKYSNQLTSFVIKNELDKIYKILRHKFYQVESLKINSVLNSRELNLFTLNFSLNKIKILKFDFKDESLYKELFNIKLPNLEELESETPLSNNTIFSLLCENYYPKLKVLKIPIKINPTDLTIHMILNSTFSQSIEIIHLPKEFFKYCSILMKYLPRLSMIVGDTIKTPIQNNMMIYGNTNSDVDDNNESALLNCIIY